MAHGRLWTGEEWHAECMGCVARCLTCVTEVAEETERERERDVPVGLGSCISWNLKDGKLQEICLEIHRWCISKAKHPLSERQSPLEQQFTTNRSEGASLRQGIYTPLVFRLNPHVKHTYAAKCSYSRWIGLLQMAGSQEGEQSACDALRCKPWPFPWRYNCPR